MADSDFDSASASAQPVFNMTFIQLLSDFARRHWRSYFVFALMLLAITSINVWLPRQVGQIVDGLVADSLSPTAMAFALGLMVLAAAANYFLRAGWRLVLFHAVYQLSVELRTRLFARLALQPPSFFQTQRTGDLMAGATNDVDAIEMAAGEGALAGFDGLLGLVMVTAMMSLGVDWRLALCALLPFPAMALAFKAISKREHAASRQALDSFAHLNDHVQESLSGVRTVRALGLLERSGQQFSGLAKAAADASFTQHRWDATYEPAVGMALSTATVISLGVGSYLVWQGELTLGQLTSFGLYLGQLIWPMFAMGWVMSLIQRGRAAWERLAPMIEAPVSVIDEGVRTDVPAPHIEFESVDFSYPGQTQAALKQVHLNLEPGKTLAIVGPTGSGKSTIVKLILRQWEANSGAVRWGGVQTDQFALASLRSQMAWVPQEPFLFSASVAQNIALAKPDASRAEIEQAARLSAVYDDIMRLPQGFDTPVGERGVTLSGGQRQRVAIARALLVDAPLLLLDDALSAVDTATETDILAHLAGSQVGRTVIVISHRLSSVVKADSTVVLRNGKIVERGTHAELVALNGWYARQWHYQQLSASLEDEA